MPQHFPHYTKSLIPNARRLRRDMTDPERKLWALVRGRHLGVKIRRQVPIGRYIVDFLCEERKLIVELDGSQHYTAEGLKRDRLRDDFLRNLGYRVLRISNDDMLRQTDSVLEEICLHLSQQEAPK